MHLPRQNATHKHALMYKTAGVYSTVKIVKRLNRTVFCNKPTELQEPQPFLNVVSSCDLYMWRNTTDLSLRRIGDSIVCVCVCVCVWDFHFSSVPSSLSRESHQTEQPSHEPSLSSRATIHSASSILRLSLSLSLCLYTCFTAPPPPSIPPRLLPPHTVFSAQPLFFSPLRIITFQRRDDIWQGNATRSCLSVFMCQCVCVAWTITPIVFPEGWANKQGVGGGSAYRGGVQLKRKN